jgi:uncharacterized protein YbjT (DUF2867 family)
MSKKVLITGATGDTGRAAVREALTLGAEVRYMVSRRRVPGSPSLDSSPSTYEIDRSAKTAAN